MSNLPSYFLGPAVFVLLELGFLLLRWLSVRVGQNFRPSWLVHFFALAAATWATFLTSDAAQVRSSPWLFLETSTLFLAIWILYDLIDVFFLRRPWDRERGPLPKLVRDVGRVLAIVLSALVTVSAIFKIPLPTVLVSSTVVSAVLGLALQDMLKNVFAGMALQLEGSFKVGDWLLIDNVPARVVDLSWRSTRLCTSEGVIFIEPNSKISERKLVQYGNGRLPVAFGFIIGLPYDAPPARAREALLSAARTATGAVSEPPPQAMIRDFGDFAIHYELRVWTREVASITVFRDHVFSRVWYELQRAGISVPFPIRDVNLHDFEKQREQKAQKQIDRLARMLGRLDLFDGLERSVVERLAGASTRRAFDNGEVLVQEGEPGDSLFVIERGRVMISKSAGKDATSPIELATLVPGDFFGEMSLLTGEPRSATVRALGDCEVSILTKEDVAPLFVADPSIVEILSNSLESRTAATEAALAARRERSGLRQKRSEGSILKRVREFFLLHH